MLRIMWYLSSYIIQTYVWIEEIMWYSIIKCHMIMEIIGIWHIYVICGHAWVGTWQESAAIKQVGS